MFFARNSDVYCATHYAALFAKKCDACSLAVLREYVETRGKHWHPRCYMLYKLWHVKVASGPSLSSSSMSKSSEQLCLKGNTKQDRVFSTDLSVNSSSPLYHLIKDSQSREQLPINFTKKESLSKEHMSVQIIDNSFSQGGSVAPIDNGTGEILKLQNIALEIVQTESPLKGNDISTIESLLTEANTEIRKEPTAEEAQQEQTAKRVDSILASLASFEDSTAESISEMLGFYLINCSCVLESSLK